MYFSEEYFDIALWDGAHLCAPSYYFNIIYATVSLVLPARIDMFPALACTTGSGILTG